MRVRVRVRGRVRVRCGRWQVVCGVWRVECGVWCVVWVCGVGLGRGARAGEAAQDRPLVATHLGHLRVDVERVVVARQPVQLRLAQVGTRV